MAVAIAFLSLPLLTGTAHAGEPGVCDTNRNTGTVDSFLQNTEPDGSGEWANGNMNASKANFVEGDWVPQRVEMSGLRPGENELAFDYDVMFSNGNKDAKWAFDDVRFKSLTGATLVRWHVENADGPTATVYLTFDVPSPSTAATLYYDLHIASELDHGAGSGAGSIPGSSYHGGLVSLNCKRAGTNANQISAGAIDAGLLTVVKEATPTDGTDFRFSITPGGDASTFSLDDDSEETLPDRLTYRVPPGTYTVEELDIPAGWTLAGIACSDTPSASTPTSRTVSLSDDENVTCTFTNNKISRRDLTVSTTASPSYHRDFDWTVDKSVVGPATRKIAEGESADFDYSVVVTPSGPQDSRFEVSGRITVSNPNQIDVAGVTVENSIPGATCTVLDAGTPVTGSVTIPAGGKDFTYTCDMGSGTTADTQGTSTASLSWSAADYYGTTGGASGAAGFDFSAVQPTVTDDSVTVTDSEHDLSTHPDGNVVRVGQGPRTFTYQLTWPGEPGACTTYDNTATITEQDGDEHSDGARVEVCEGKDLTVEKTVVHDYYRTYDWSLEKAVVGPSEKEVGPDGTATFDYEVTATAGSAQDSSWGMSGTIKVSNPNDWPVTLSDVQDQVDIGGGASCPVSEGEDLTVPANGDRTFAYTCSFDSQPSYDGTNTATVTWDAAEHVSPHTSATGTAAVVAANWTETSVDKTITIVDDKTDPANPVPIGTAEWAGEGTTKVITYTGPALKGTEGRCVDYTNNAWVEEDPQTRASAVARVCWPADLTVTKDVQASYDTTYFWDVTKDVDRSSAEVSAGETAPFTYTVVAKPNGSEDSGWRMSGTITVSNPNTYKPVTVELSDEYDGGGVCSPASSTVEVPAATLSNGTVTPGTAEVTYSCAFTEKPEYTGTNTVTATWDGGETTGTANVSFRQDGKTDYQVQVLDDQARPGTEPEVLDTVAWDDPLEKRTFTYTLDRGAAPGQCVDHTNTAWVDVTAGDVAVLPGVLVEGLDPFAQQTVTVCEKAPLVVSKDVTATYDTQYFWDITKDVDQRSAEVGPGGTAPFTYTVVAKPTESVDSNWKMSGTITLTNPNDFEPITVRLSDEYDGGGVCTPESETVEVPEGGSVEVGYDCDFTEGQPEYTGTNTVTATWDGQTVTATAPVTFRQANTTDYEVEVRDDLTQAGTSGEPLGTVQWDDPVEDRTFTNTLDLGASAGQCVDHTNTAWVVVEGDDPTASRTVEVCEELSLVVSKDARATYDTQYFWDISKEVDRSSAEVGPDGKAPFEYTVVAEPAGSRDLNWRMSGTIRLTNPNAYKAATVSLEDEYDGGGTCTPQSETVEVPAGGSLDVPYSCVFDDGQPEYTGTNTVTATWNGRMLTATAPVSFERVNRLDHEVAVYDDQTRPGEEELLDIVAWDDPLEERTFRNTLELGAAPGECVDHTNTAWVELGVTPAWAAQLGLERVDPSAQQTVRVCEKAPLGVSKDATASYDTRYFWDVSKAVDTDYAEVGRGGKAPFTYTVVAKPNGSQDSGWEMSGTITVTNPNTYEDATVTLSGNYEGGGECTPDEPSVVVPRATGSGDTLTPGSVEVGYSCTFTDKPGYSGDVTTTVTWDGETFTGTAPVTFRQDGRTDFEVDVLDDQAQPGAAPKVLDTVDWDDTLEERTFTYTRDLGAASGECQEHTNTAWVPVEGDDPSAQQTVRVCEKALLVVSKTATATYDTRYFWDITKDVDRSYAEVGPGGSAPFEYTVVAKPNGSANSNWQLKGTITVTNPNRYRTATVTLEDEYDGGGTCTPESETVEVPRGESVEVAYTCDFTEEPSHAGTNTVTATWDGQVFEATAPVTFEQVGRTDYEVEVRDDLTRPGTDEPLGTVAFDDPAEKRTFKRTLSFGAEPGRCVTPTNTAWVVVEGDDPSAKETVEVCSEAGLVISDEVDASFDRTYRWLVDKSVDESSVEVTEDGDAKFHYTVKAVPDGFTDSAYTMGGTITVTNPNTYAGGAITATVTDVPAVGQGATCDVDGGENVVLEPRQTKELGYTCSFDVDPDHQGTNTAVATWTGPGDEQRTASTGAVPVTFEATGHANRTVTVSDDQTDPPVLGQATWNAEGTPSLFEYDLVHEGVESTCVDYRNTARIEETGQADSEWVTVCREGRLVVTNTADASYDRTYEWDITKVADRDRITTAKGETGTVGYTVGVTPLGFTDSGWEMSGAVSVSNPNDYKDVTIGLNSVPDLGEGASCVFDETDDLVVAAGDTRVFGYSCTFDGQPSYDGSNTAVVDWGTGRVSAVADPSFEVDEEVDKVVTVTDDHVDPTELGTVTWDESGATTEFSYDLEVEGLAGRCETITNTAALVETGQQAKADVVVCGRREPEPEPGPGPSAKGRPPVKFLPETGAPSNGGLWTTIGGLMLTIGAVLVARRRRLES